MNKGSRNLENRWNKIPKKVKNIPTCEKTKIDESAEGLNISVNIYITKRCLCVCLWRS